MMTDPIADMITRIRNAHISKKREVVIPYSNLKHAMAGILVAEGYLEGMHVQDQTPKKLVLSLKYHGNRPGIQSIVRDSKPGHRMYKHVKELPRVLNGYGIAIVSTSQGLMTNKEAKKRGIGGEVICSVY